MLLEAADWTQIEAGEQLGISQGSVSDCSSGKRMLSTKGIESIAYRLGIPAEAFTARPISLEQMRKMLAGTRSSKVSERRGIYHTIRRTTRGSARSRTAGIARRAPATKSVSPSAFFSALRPPMSSSG